MDFMIEIAVARGIAPRAQTEVVYVQVKHLDLVLVERVLKDIVLVHAVVEKIGDVHHQQDEVRSATGWGS